MRSSTHAQSAPDRARAPTGLRRVFATVKNAIGATPHPKIVGKALLPMLREYIATLDGSTAKPAARKTAVSRRAGAKPATARAPRLAAARAVRRPASRKTAPSRKAAA